MSYAENTKKSYRTHLNCYMQFCQLCGIAPVPVSTDNMCRYAAYLAGIKHLSANSVPKYLNIIRVLHREFGFPNPMQESWFLDHVLRGIKKQHGLSVKKKLPITPTILLQIKQSLDMDAPVNVVFWAVCLVLFFGLLRKSNVLATQDFSAQKHLCRGDIYAHIWGLHLDLRWTKTLQDKSRVLQVPLPRILGHPLCPTTAVIQALDYTKGAPNQGPAFCYSAGGQFVPLSYPVFIKMLKCCLKKLGYPESDYAGHSFRRGGASWALRNNIPGEFIQMLGDWKSQVYREYLEVPLVTKAQQVHLMLSNITF